MLGISENKECFVYISYSNHLRILVNTNKFFIMKKKKHKSNYSLNNLFYIRSIKGISINDNVRRRRITIRSINSKRANIVDNK